MNTKNIIIGTVIAAVILGGLFVAGKKSSSPQAGRENQSGIAAGQRGGEALAPQDVPFSFGSVSMAAGTVSRTLTFKNAGAAPLAIERIYTSCMCTKATLIAGNKRTGPFGMPGHGFLPTISQSVAPGEEISVEVVFDPAAHGPAGVGRIERAVYLEGAGGRLAVIQFDAFVTP